MGEPTKSDAPAGSDADGTLTDSLLREVARVAEVPIAGPDADLTRTRIGRYRVTGLLGRGGMGVVYLAEDETLHREVALKVLPASFEADEERRRRLLREARAAAAVTHPNIATVYDVGEHEGRLFIAMERVEGKSLRDRLEEKRLPIEEAVGIARQVLRGLSKAHEAGFVHRDLKPDNILIADEGHVKILDFGLAKREEIASSKSTLGHAETLTHATATEEGRLMGTPAYMSPEQARGDGGLDRRSDIFSFGVMLYEMLAGKRPFNGRTLLDLLVSLQRDTPERLSKIDRAIPAELSRIVERCLAKEPEGRYGDCHAILAELDGTGIDERPGKRRKGRSAVWMAVLGLVGLVGAGAMVWRSKTEAASGPPAPSASVAPAPRPTAMTDLPLPASKSSEALVAYAQGMQAWRDANWGQAAESFKRTITLDPSLAIAHLRVAYVIWDVSANESRESFARAVQGRNTMSERERVLLDALEPKLGRNPVDRKLLLERLYQATERYPLDAQLFDLIAGEDDDSGRKLRAANRATELDPQFANAWQVKGIALAELGRMEESLQALDHCVSIAPFSADCLAERGKKYGDLGRCVEMEADLRRAVTAVPKALPVWYDNWAMALRATGQLAEAVLMALSKKWEQYPEQERRWLELVDRAQLDLVDGQFDQAEQRLLEARRVAASDLRSDTQWHIEATLDGIYWHTRQSKKHVALARDNMKRQAAWTKRSNLDDHTVRWLRSLLHEGVISSSEFSARRADWLASVRRDYGDDPLYEWLEGSLWYIVTEDEAKQALAATARVPKEARDRDMRHNPIFHARMYALAGRTDEALPLLRRAAASCWAPRYAPGYMGIRSLLGQALEQQGDTSGACAEYQYVLDRWGNAKPRSWVAEEARARSKALGCGK